MNLHRNRTYGRRKGKSLRPRQAAALAQGLPDLSVKLDNISSNPAAQFTRPVEDIWLEIGFGGGEHLLDLAQRKSAIGMFGCEPFVNGVVKLITGIQESGVENIRIHAGDAVDLLEKLPAASIGRIYLLYPDPWPKPRQRKRRFVNEANLASMARVLKDGGELRFASDIDDYCRWTLGKIRSTGYFEDDSRNAEAVSQPWRHWLPTRYELKARREGRSSSYYKFKKN